ncbi:glutathione S-transferase Mu 2-like isoform X1 [Haemaphysalis longicornis]
MVPVLGYWDCRALAESIRYLLAHAGVTYEDKRYGFGSGPEPTRQEWLQEKYELELDFPNVPYFIDGDVRITQSMAILRYLGRQHGLAPKDEDTRQRVEVLELTAFDVMKSILRLCYEPGYSEEKRKQFLVIVADKLRQFVSYLAKHGPFCAGQDVTYADFLLYETLQVVKILGPRTFREGYPQLEEYCKRVASLPKVKEYLASDRFKKWPVFSPFAEALGPQHKPPADDC